MPQFILEGTDDPRYQALDDFTKGYIEAMFFADMPEDEEWSVCQIHSSAFVKISADCAGFQNMNKITLARAYEKNYTPTNAGQDFWLTRQGHGVGFWDRGLGQVGEVLASAARFHGER